LAQVLVQGHLISFFGDCRVSIRKVVWTMANGSALDGEKLGLLLKKEHVQSIIFSASSVSELLLFRSTSPAKANLCEGPVLQRLSKRKIDASLPQDVKSVRSLAVAIAAKNLADRNSRKRSRALQALSKLAQHGDALVVEQLLHCARSPYTGVRCDAMSALPKYAAGDNIEVLTEVMNSCGFNCKNRDGNSEKLLTAAESSLLELAAKSPEEIPEMIVHCLASRGLLNVTIGYPGIRQRSAEKVLVQLARIGGKRAQEAMDAHLGPAWIQNVKRRQVEVEDIARVHWNSEADSSLLDENSDLDSDFDGLPMCETRL